MAIPNENPVPDLNSVPNENPVPDLNSVLQWTQGEMFYLLDSDPTLERQKKMYELVKGYAASEDYSSAMFYAKHILSVCLDESWKPTLESCDVHTQIQADIWCWLTELWKKAPDDQKIKLFEEARDWYKKAIDTIDSFDRTATDKISVIRISNGQNGINSRKETLTQELYDRRKRLLRIFCSETWLLIDALAVNNIFDIDMMIEAVKEAKELFQLWKKIRSPSKNAVLGRAALEKEDYGERLDAALQSLEEMKSKIATGLRDISQVLQKEKS